MRKAKAMKKILKRKLLLRKGRSRRQVAGMLKVVASLSRRRRFLGRRKERLMMTTGPRRLKLTRKKLRRRSKARVHPNQRRNLARLR